jgi:putative colanic acid biosysnthesis UDP-glucose lipid carrier transferase
MKTRYIKNISIVFWIVQACDGIIICFILWLLASYYNIFITNFYTAIAVSAVLVYTTIQEFNSSRNFKYDGVLHVNLNKIVKAWALTVTFLIIILFLFKITTIYSRLTLGVWFVSTPFVLFIFRFLIRFIFDYLGAKQFYQHRVAVLGNSDVASNLVMTINKSQYLGLKIVKTYSSTDIKQCIGAAINGEFDRLYIVKKAGQLFESENMLRELSDSSVLVYYVPDLLEIELKNSTWSTVGDIDVMSISDSPIQGFNSLIKRFVDIILSTIILILISPVLIVTCLAIRLKSKGPILFKQTRYGLNGKEIKVWKFRSMSVCEDQKIIQVTKDDSRVTNVGKFIRKTSIDELPQFFNVLAGTMSIVGPRPHAVQHNEEFRKIIPHYMRRHTVKPGITGWAQVNGWRGETDTVEKIIKRTEYDMYYIKNWSFWLDIKIILITIQKEILNKRVY